MQIYKRSTTQQKTRYPHCKTKHAVEKNINKAWTCAQRSSMFNETMLYELNFAIKRQTVSTSFVHNFFFFVCWWMHVPFAGAVKVWPKQEAFERISVHVISNWNMMKPQQENEYVSIFRELHHCTWILWGEIFHFELWGEKVFFLRQ